MLRFQVLRVGSGTPDEHARRDRDLLHTRRHAPLWRAHASVPLTAAEAERRSRTATLANLGPVGNRDPPDPTMTLVLDKSWRGGSWRAGGWEGTRVLTADGRSCRAGGYSRVLTADGRSWRAEEERFGVALRLCVSQWTDSATSCTRAATRSSACSPAQRRCLPFCSAATAPRRPPASVA